MIINETNDQANAGKLEHTGNELLVDSKVEDPAKVRMGAPAGEALGALSGDRLEGGTRLEKVLVIFKDTPQGGQYEFFAQMPGTSDDAGMKRLLTLDNTGATFYVPVKSAKRKIALRSLANGKLVCAENGGNDPLIANRDYPGLWETFEVVEL